MDERKTVRGRIAPSVTFRRGPFAKQHAALHRAGSDFHDPRLCFGLCSACETVGEDPIDAQDQFGLSLYSEGMV
jgi:hypothetical protein